MIEDEKTMEYTTVYLILNNLFKLIEIVLINIDKIDSEFIGMNNVNNYIDFINNNEFF